MRINEIKMENNKWKMDKETTNYKLLGAYAAKIIGYSTIDFFSKNSLNIFHTREDRTVKKLKKSKNVCRGALIKKNCLQRKISHSPLQKKNGLSLH